MAGCRAGVIGWCVLAAAGCRAPPAPPAPSPADVETALALAVGLLEARDHVGFVERFVPPADLDCAAAAGDTPADVAAARLADPGPLLARLRAARRAAPAFGDRGATAVFEAGGARVVFRRVDGVWYLDWA